MSSYTLHPVERTRDGDVHSAMTTSPLAFCASAAFRADRRLFFSAFLNALPERFAAVTRFIAA